LIDKAGTGALPGRWIVAATPTGVRVMKRVAILLALLPSGSTPALARGGAHVEMHVGPNSARSAPSTIAAHGDSPLMGGPFPSSTGVGGMPDPGAPFNPSGVGVPGGNGPGNTTITPNMTPPPVNTGPTGPGGTFATPGVH